MFVEIAAVPPLSVNGPIPVSSAPTGVAISETCPLGVPPDAVTLTVKLALAPCVIVPLGEAVIVVIDAVRPTIPHTLVRFATFTVPRPVVLPDACFRVSRNSVSKAFTRACAWTKFSCSSATFAASERLRGQARKQAAFDRELNGIVCTPRILDEGEVEGRFFFDMEFVRGPDGEALQMRRYAASRGFRTHERALDTQGQTRPGNAARP